MSSPALRRALLASGVGALLSFAPAAVAAPLPASGTLDLATEADARLAGERFGDEAGGSVSPAGDVNGDGQLDLLVPARRADPGGRTDAGSAFVVFGPIRDLPDRLAQLGPRGLRIDGARAGDLASTSVSQLGDVDGDGLGDVLVGAPGARAAFLVRGRREGGTIDLAGAPGVTRLGTGAETDRTGASVGRVPDLDGDGRAELVIGAPGAGTERAGAAFVVFSRAAGGDVDLDALGDRGLRLDGATRSEAGLAVNGAPDLNGDGRGEILVGAPRLASGGPDASGTQRAQGAGYVVFGRAEPGRIDLTALGAQGITVAAGADDEALGAAVAPVGDQTGDGVPDVAFGAPDSDRNSREGGGSVHVIAGTATGGTVAAGAADRPGFRIDGAATGDALGVSVSEAGDINRDGREDLVATAPSADALSRTDAGSAYVLFGRERGEDLDLSGLRDRGFRLAGPTPSARLIAMVGAGDLNGDGSGDLLAGAPDASEGDTQSGSAYVVFGPPPPAPAPPPDPGVAAELEAGCAAVTNVQVVVDDSITMRRADPRLLRRQAIELLLTKPRNEGKVVGAYEFGAFGNQLFAPQVVLPRGPGSNQALLGEALRQGIRGDNRGTDYNAAFKGAADDNPAAQARVFITDGRHARGAYLDPHRGGAPTYVVGLGVEADTGAGRRLERIASETEGRAFLDVGAAELPGVLNEIDSALNCDVDIDSDSDLLNVADPTDSQVVDLLPDARTCDIDVNWGDDDDAVEPEEIAFIDDEGDVMSRVTRKQLRRVVAKPGRTFTFDGIRLKGRRQGTFFGLRIAGSTPSTRLRVRYRATKVAGKGVALTSQVTQSRRRQVEQVRGRS